jgi:hypothetical protein
MRWSKLRSLVIERFAEPLQGRLDIHSAAYGNCSCGHAWLTLDGEMIANFCTRAHANAEYVIPRQEPDPLVHYATNRMYDEQLAAYGERSRQDVYRTLFDYVHNVPVKEALVSDDMLFRALAIVDSRVGKRRLAQLAPEALHPLCAYLLMLRRGDADGITPADYAALRREAAVEAA